MIFRKKRLPDENVNPVELVPYPEPAYLYGARGNGSSFAPWVPGVFTSPVMFFHSVIDWLVHWFFSRRWSLMLPALPAVLAVVVALVLYVPYRRGVYALDLQRSYERNLDTALKDKRWDDAVILVNSLMARHPNELRYKFVRAQIAQGMQQPQLAQSLISELSPLDKPGFAAARLVVAQSAIEQKRLPLAQRQLELALEEQPQNANIAMGYANLLIGMGRFDQAARALEALAVKDGPINFQLARLYRQSGQVDEAAKLFQAAGDDFSKKFSINNDNNFALLAAESYLAVDQWPAAVKVIDAAIEREPDNAQLRNMRAHVQADLAADYFKRGEYQKQWQQIESILSYAPNNPEALAQMVELAFAQGDKVPEASQRVDQLLVSGQAPAAVHLILGTRAAQVGDLDKAHLHLEQAKNQNPNAPVVLNNLAWVLAHAEPPRLEEASIVIEEALKMAPDVADILDTRAEIAISRGKPKDAITDLDKALKLRPSHKPYLERLVKAYQDAGDDDSAARIEKQIKAMK